MVIPTCQKLSVLTIILLQRVAFPNPANSPSISPSIFEAHPNTPILFSVGRDGLVPCDSAAIARMKEKFKENLGKWMLVIILGCTNLETHTLGGLKA